MQKLTLTTAVTLALILPALAQDMGGATATFMAPDGTELGSVTLTQSENGVDIVGQVMGIMPAGSHGMHFHETGSCDGSTDFESAGDHFNPAIREHGLENAAGPHAGDLPNVTAGEDGMVAIDLSSDMISLTQGDEAYVFDDDGTAIVIHAAADDQLTDPSGNSGDRIACAVIEAAPAT
jgi:Cu-Zn family superoxide dismutase